MTEKDYYMVICQRSPPVLMASSLFKDMDPKTTDTLCMHPASKNQFSPPRRTQTYEFFFVCLCLLLLLCDWATKSLNAPGLIIAFPGTCPWNPGLPATMKSSRFYSVLVFASITCTTEPIGRIRAGWIAVICEGSSPILKSKSTHSTGPAGVWDTRSQI